jgi:hypothetical protein
MFRSPGRAVFETLPLFRCEIEAEQPIDGAVEPAQKICRHESPA